MSALERRKCSCANCFVAASGHAPDDKIIRCHNTREIVFPAFVVKLLAVVEAIEGHDIENLGKKVTYLKQTDSEGWAVGEMLRRALEL